ncbi:hypothetical protein Droror1_Dr00001898 [Drosera rotundifolia]
MSLDVERRILRHLHNPKTQTHLHQIHAHFIRHQLHQSNQIISHFISTICNSHHKTQYAESIFQQTLFPNLQVFNSMIKGYSLFGPFEKALVLFSQMKGCDMRVDEYTFAPLIKACGGLRDVRVGECVHGGVLRNGLGGFRGIGIGLVELYSGWARMRDALKVFEEMPERKEVVVWNFLINGFCKGGDVETGLWVFRGMSERSVVSWNVVLSWLAKSGRDGEALRVFEEMKGDGFRPDEATVVTVLPVCARLGAVYVGEWIVSYAAEFSNLFVEFVTVGNAIVNFYCKCGDLIAAQKFFRDMPQKNVTSWNTMISGLAYNGKNELGLTMFDEMIHMGVRPDHSSFVAVLTCCAHGKLVQKGRDYFDLMTQKYQLQPRLEHYGCMVDLLGRVGCVREAYKLIRGMPMRPNTTIWGSLLSSSRTYSVLELAECAVNELIDLGPWESGNYVLLSNIKAEGGKWESAEEVRLLMDENSVKKVAGQSIAG